MEIKVGNPREYTDIHTDVHEDREGKRKKRLGGVPCASAKCLNIKNHVNCRNKPAGTNKLEILRYSLAARLDQSIHL